MSLDLSRIQAICFDVDGTLSDTDDQWIAAIERRISPLRRLFPGGDLKPFARWAIMCAETPGNLVYHLLDRSDLDDEVGRLYSFLCRLRVNQAPKQFLIIQGMREALCLIKQHYPMSVVSARDQASTQAFLNQFELSDLFSSVATALTCRHTKPFADPILWAAEKMGVDPHNCLMVGDTAVDIRAGKAAGAQTVGVLCGFGQEAELRRAGADLILPCTSSLVEILLAGQSLPESRLSI